MKISLNWLKDYININLPSKTIADKMTLAGIEVERMEEKSDDVVFEVEVTPNRADCLNMLGVAREFSAIFNKALKEPKIIKTTFPKNKCDIQILDKQGCLRYIGVLIENVHISSTPEKILKRLSSIGSRSINNVVDITNFSLLENGQPLHAFDYDKLIGGKIIVRRANQGEKIVTIDGVERTLDPSILVIADAKRAVAIAGIMGGKETEVSSQTKNILLESAYFDPILIRKASRKLGLSSDSSYRFERGVDYPGVERGVRRATDLILDSAKGKIVKYNDLEVSKKKQVLSKIIVTKKEINDFLGTDIEAKQIQNILINLGFTVRVGKKEGFVIEAPSFSPDVKRAVDVIEEVARVFGYDKIPVTLPSIKPANIFVDTKTIVRNSLRDILIAQGFNEVVTYTMYNRKSLEKSLQNDLQGLQIVNPLTQDQEIMRPSLFPNLLSVIQENVNRGQKDLKFFEIGKVYTKEGEREVLAILLSGVYQKDWQRSQKRMCNFFDVKGVIDQTFNRLDWKGYNYLSSSEKYLENGQQAALVFKGEIIGCLGKVEGEVLSRWDIKQNNVLFAQIFLEELLSLPREDKRYSSISEYPAIVRDISLAIKKEISYEQIKTIALANGLGLLTSIEFIEEYLGDKIPSGQRGVVVSLNYQSTQRTLREEEVNVAHEKVCQAVIHQLEAVKR